MTDTELCAGIETPDQTENAAARAFMRCMAEQSAVLLGMACKREPDVVRRALAELYDTTGIEQSMQNLLVRVQELWQRFDRYRDAMNELETTVARLENRVSAAEHHQERPAGPVRLYESEPDEIPFGNTETPWDQLA